MIYRFFFITVAAVLLPLQWETDFTTAKQKASESHKNILLYFSGSDWCAPCIQTRKNYLDSETFSAMAETKLVLLNADFPRRKANQLSAEQQAKNDALAEKYNPDGEFPLTILLDENGKVIQKWSGKPKNSVQEFTDEVRSLCSK